MIVYAVRLRAAGRRLCVKSSNKRHMFIGSCHVYGHFIADDNSDDAGADIAPELADYRDRLISNRIGGE